MAASIDVHSCALVRFLSLLSLLAVSGDGWALTRGSIEAVIFVCGYDCSPELAIDESRVRVGLGLYAGVRRLR